MMIAGRAMQKESVMSKTRSTSQIKAILLTFAFGNGAHTKAAVQPGSIFLAPQSRLFPPRGDTLHSQAAQKKAMNTQGK